jgi:hypothetical protein
MICKNNRSLLKKLNKGNPLLVKGRKVVHQKIVEELNKILNTNDTKRLEFERKVMKTLST